MIPPMLNMLLQQRMGMMPQLQANPAQMLQRAGFNVPADIRDPHKIVDHLVQSGQLPQQQLAQMQQALPGFKF